MTVGSARPLENAWKAGQVDMIRWLGELHGLDQLDAYQLLTQIAETPLANVVVTNFSVVTKINKNLLPGAPTYDGMHALMNDRVATLGSISY